MSLHLVTGHAGTAHITAEDHGAFNAGIIGTGDYVLNTGTKLAASIISNNIIRITDGDAIIQGRHVNLKVGTYEEVNIANGTQDMVRHDLIVLQYEKDTSTGVESIYLAVLQGEASSGTAEDPVVTTGDILGGATLHEMPLYRVVLNGLTVEAVEPLFESTSTVSELANQLGGWTIKVVEAEPVVKEEGVLYFVKKAVS